jgi:periplasmic divalent cation tolerance protein
MSSTEFIIVFVTTANKGEAEKISQTLLKEKLIACANIINPVKSFFHWKGSVNCADECLLIMKTRRDLFSSLLTQVKELHSYDVPEILALPIVECSAEYLIWMSESLK